MSTSIQNIIDRAVAFNPLNRSLAGDSVELCTRVQQLQQGIYTALASLPMALLGRSKFVVLEALTSSGGSAGRTVDLTTVTTPMERLIRVSLGSMLPPNQEVLPVTEFDVNVQLPPRYAIRGTTLFEISSDWGVPGAVSVNLLHCIGAASINVTSGNSQLVSVPDEWIDLLVLPLARYFVNKDPGRDPVEYQWLDAQYSEKWTAFLNFATNYAGEFSVLAQFPPPAGGARQGQAA